MFGFISGDKTPRTDIFNIEEIRQLVLDFPPPVEKADNDNTLVPLKSGDGLTTRNAITKAYISSIKGRYGKIPIEALEKQLDVERNTLLDILRSRDDFLLSRSKDCIFTACDQERILEEVYARARSRFVRASVAAEDHDLDIRDLPKLISLSKKSMQDSPLQLLDAQGRTREKSLEFGSSYLHTLATLLELRRSISDRCVNAHSAGKVATWDKNDFQGLDIPTFAKLAHKFAQENNGHEPLYGFFESDKDEVRYVTKSYLLRKAKRALKEVAMGEEAYCDLDQLVKKYPTLLPDVEAAKQMAMTECLHKDGNKYKWHFISHYAIGDAGLNNTAKRCMETLGPQRYLNTQPFVQVFPPTIRNEVTTLLQDQIVLFWRYCGGEVLEVIGLGAWMVLMTMIRDIETAAKRLGRTCADEAFTRQDTGPSLKDDIGRTAFLLKLQEESDLPLELLERIWNDARVKIKSDGMASYEQRLAELKAETRNWLEVLWRARAYIPAHVHTDALEKLEAGPLQDQLRDLLHAWLTQDLLPSIIKRVRTKGLLKDASDRKQVEKLENSITDKKRAQPIAKSLERFHEKMGFSALSGEETSEAQAQQLGSMVAAMEQDTDAPRLFLTTVLVLLAQKKNIGILYATGKFAPRLLKLLKANLEPELYKDLERLKEAVKAGSVTEDDRVEMRNITIQFYEQAP